MNFFMTKMTVAASGLLIAAGVLMPGSASAQDFPAKEVTFLVPFGPGGASDTYGRYVADALAKRWGHPVVVENRPGAGSAVGTAQLAKAKPDGYTLLFTSGSYGATPATQKELSYDPEKDLVPVALVGVGDLFVMTGTRVPLDNLADLQTQAKAQVMFSVTPGLGSIGHLAQLLLNGEMGIKTEFVHQTSGAAQMTEIKGGRVDTVVGTQLEVMSGLAKPIVVMSDKRNPGYPDVPTVVEAGFPAAQAVNWVGAFAPAGTPKDIVDKINRDFIEVLKQPEVVKFFEGQALRTSNDTPEEFATFVHGELAKWKTVAEKSGLRD
jgi:tripartite-type tricarboxylate transporter receptor subunit TctC